MYPGDGARLTLDLNVQGMKLAINTALSTHHGELQQLVNAEVERMKPELPAMVRAAVRKGVEAAIIAAVQDQAFKLRTAIGPAIGAAVKDVLEKADFREGE